MTFRNQELIDKVDKIRSLMDKEKYEEALFYSKKLIKEYNESAFSYGLAGEIYLELKKYNEASEHFRKSVMYAPKSERASLGLFYSLWGASDFLTAIKEMQRFLSIGVPNEYLLLIEDLLEDVNEAYAVKTIEDKIQLIIKKYRAFSKKADKTDTHS